MKLPRSSFFQSLLVLAACYLPAVSTLRSQTVETLVQFPWEPANPDANVIEGSDGNFYGTTFQGGAGNSGTVFKITPDGDWTILFSFVDYDENGRLPVAKLLEGDDGSFYGTTLAGGIHDLGTIFRITPNGELTTLATFDSTNGSAPGAELIQMVISMARPSAAALSAAGPCSE